MLQFLLLPVAISIPYLDTLRLRIWEQQQQQQQQWERQFGAIVVSCFLFVVAFAFALVDPQRRFPFCAHFALVSLF